jgi:hypothetical protein
VVDPEADCDGCDALSLRIYELERDVTVRALFDGSALGMLLVVRVDPPIRWRGAQGSLGETSFAEASTFDSGGKPATALPPAAVEFRRRSRPNTYGAFRDDGRVGGLVREADFVNRILLAGTFG